MKKSKELAKNTFIIFFGTMCTKLITFILLPLYTGILSTEEYGTVDLLTTLVSLLIPIVTFQVEQAVFRELIEYRDDEEQQKRIISSAFYSLIMQCVIYCILFLVIYPFINNEYKIFLALNVITTIFSSLFLQISRGLGDNKKYAIGSFISAFFTIIFNVLLLVVIKLRVNGMLIGIMGGQIVSAIYLFFYLKLYKFINRKKFNKKTVKELWKYSIPLIPNSLSWWVFSSSDRVIVSLFLGLSMNGILSAASKFSAAYTILYNTFDRSWIESISVHINDGDIEEYFNKMFNEILKIFTSIMLVLISTMPFIYNIMINKKFLLGYKLVPILMVGALFNVVQGLIVVVYAAKKDTKSIAKTSFAAALINILIHFGLLKFIGIYAAAISTLGAYLIIAIYRFIDVKKRYLNVKIDKKTMLFSTIILSVEIAIYYSNNLILKIVSIVASIIVAFIFNKNSISFIKNMILNKKKKVVL